MKKNLLVILFVVLFIWNVILTSSFYNLKKSSDNINQPVINDYNVSGFSTDLTRVVDEVKSSVVTIESNGISSGFIYKQDNDKVYVLTTYHGVSEDRVHFVVFDSLYRKEAKLIAYDIYCDLAVLEVELPYEVSVCRIGDSEFIKDGEFLMSIGTPTSLDYKGSVELGLVSSNLRFIDNEIVFEEENRSFYSAMIQMSDTYKAGYSGAPLFNMSGEVVGMCIMEDENGVDFALPINEAVIVADKILKAEEYNRINLGVRGLYVSKMLNYERNNFDIPIDITEGLYINRVKDNSLAYKLGIRAGDVLLSIDNNSIKTHNDYLKIIYNLEDIETVEVNRNGETVLLERASND